MLKLIISGFFMLFLYSEYVLDEKSFLYQVLQLSYDVKIIEHTMAEARAAEIVKSGAMYKPTIDMSGSVNKSLNDTNNLANHNTESDIKTLSVKFSKVFQTKTILSFNGVVAMSETESMTYKTKSISNTNTIGGMNLVFPDYKTTNYLEKKTSFEPKLTVSLVQPLLKEGLFLMPGRAMIRLNKNFRKISRHTGMAALESYAMNVLMQYHSFVINMKIFEINRKSCEDMEVLDQKNEKKFSIGVINEIDRKFSAASLLKEKLSIIESEKNLRNDLEKLCTALKTNFLLEDVNNTILVSDVFSPGQPDYRADEIISALTNTSRELAIARLTVENNELSLRMIKNSIMPKLDLTASFTMKGFTNTDNSSDRTGSINRMFREADDYYDFYAGFEFSMPFLTPTERASKIEKQMALQKAEGEMKSKIDQLQVDTGNLLRDIAYLHKAMESYREISSHYDRMLDLARRDYDNGKISAKDLDDYMRMARGAQISLAVHDMRYRLSVLQLEYKRGNLLSLYGIDTGSNL